MPVYSPTQQHQITPTVDQEQGRVGQIPRQFQFQADKGIPRFEDLLTLRVLERSPTVSLPLNTIRTQVTTPDWGIRPTVESPSRDHEQAVDELETFFDGNFNPNGQKLSHLLKLWVTDILSPDTGTLELVPSEPDSDGQRWLSEIWHLDGITMSKDLDEHGQIPTAPKPAYWQFAPRSALANTTWNHVLEALESTRTRSVLRGYGRRSHKPVPFTREQVVWLERNPQTATNYGFGKVQQVRHWAEILLNVDISNAKYFSEHEIPQGIMHINAGSRKELNRARDYMRDTLRGETDHVAPMFDARSSEDIGWIPIQGTPEELQFLDSQQWYHKLVWFLFGLNQGEIGDFESGNRSMGEYHGRQVFRQTTKPLLDDLTQTINQQILPTHEAYWRVDGEVEFFVEVSHEQMEALERDRQESDLDNLLTTPNEIRQERGSEEVPWGDMPKPAIEQLARKHPEWAAEQWGDIPEEELPDTGIGGDVDLLSGHSSTHTPDASQPAADDDDSGGSGNAPKAAGSDPSPYERHQGDTGEVGDQFPAVADLIGDVEGEVGRLLATELEGLEEVIEQIWPDEGSDESIVVDVDRVLDDVHLRDDLLDPVVDGNTQAMQAAAEEDAARLEEALEEEFALHPEVAQISLDFDLQDTFAWEAMRRRAARNMVSVEESVKEQVRNVLLDVAEDGGDVQEATNALRDRVDEISDTHSRLVARTELPQASREGTQALGESTEVIGGKRWLASNDSRSRPWHDAMHEEVVGVDDDWVVPSGWQGEPHYQPSDYPRSAHIVGEDQPFNCRCVQQNVLEEDLPDDVRSLDEWRGIAVDVHVTDRQFDVWREHAQSCEDFATMLDRLDGQQSRTQLAEDLCKGSKKQLYRWLDDYDLR